MTAAKTPEQSAQLWRQQAPDSAEDAFGMRDSGIADLHALGGPAWSDFNPHDPGVTFLEELCYGLADLGYLAGADMADLLSSADGTLDLEALGLFPPRRILSTSPLSETDYRKVILDELAPVENVWFEDAGGMPGTLGFRAVRFLSRLDATGSAILAAAIGQCLHRHRALGAFFLRPEACPLTPVWVEVDLEESPSLDTAQLLERLAKAIQDVLTPTIRFRPRGAEDPSVLSEWTGPTLAHGLLDDADLWLPLSWDEAKQKVEQAVSLLAEVSDARLHSVSVNTEGDRSESHVFVLSASKSVVLVHSPYAPKGDPYPLPSLLRTSIVDRASGLSPLARADDATLQGSSLDAGRYASIQRDLPSLYGLGSEHQSAPVTREALSVLQLKAYLAVFDQMLANTHQSLGRLPFLLAPVASESEAWTQPIYDVPGIVPLLKSFVDQAGTPVERDAARRRFESNPNNGYRQALERIAEGWSGQGEARREILTHLLARFGQALPPQSEETFETNRQLADWVQAMPDLSHDRGKALELTSADGQSTIEQLAALVLCLPGSEREPAEPALRVNPATPDAAGYVGRAYFLLEHAALLDPTALTQLAPVAPGPCPLAGRPGTADATRVPVGFFVQRLSNLLSNWTERTLTPRFMHYVTSMLEPHMPAHLVADWHWLPAQKVREFSDLYAAWAHAGHPALDATSRPRCCAAHLVVSASGPAYPLLRFVMDLTVSTEDGR